MSSAVIILLIFGVLLLLALAVAYANGAFSGGTSQRSSIQSLVAAQRKGFEAGGQGPKRARPTLMQVLKGAEVQKVRKTDSRLTLKKRLKYAQWRLPVVLFRALEVSISLAVFSLVSLKFNIVLRLIALLAGPIFMRWLLNTSVERRFKRFDADYPQFLMSLVGLLKTGMTAVGALEAAAEGMEQGSLVKHEVELMIERLRFGVSEDKSIGSFGEDIYHPEIELFVQALLLSRRVGGTLSETLERLAKQVRKRQYFRTSAVGAVGMQRGSIWILVLMLCLIEFYLYMVYPGIVVDSLNSEIGWQVWQVAIVLILLGIFWVRQVTKIRV